MSKVRIFLLLVLLTTGTSARSEIAQTETRRSARFPTVFVPGTGPAATGVPVSPTDQDAEPRGVVIPSQESLEKEQSAAAVQPAEPAKTQSDTNTPSTAVAAEPSKDSQKPVVETVQPATAVQIPDNSQKPGPTVPAGPITHRFPGFAFDIIMWERGSLRVWMAPSIRDKIEKSYGILDTGALRVFDLLGQRPVDKPLTIWLLKDDTEVRTVLQGLGYRAEVTGAVRSKSDVVLRIDPSLPFDWLLRYMLSEYAGYLLNSSASKMGLQKDGLEWLKSGMGIGIGWYVAEEIEKGDWTSASKKISSYYMSHIKPEPELSFERISSAKWPDLLKANKTQLIARTALLYIWTCEKNGPTCGNAVLESWRQGGNLNDVLQKSADISADDLKKRFQVIEGTPPQS